MLTPTGSMKLFKHLQKETNFDRDLELNENGYLMLAYSDRSLEEIEATIPFQRARGVHVEFINKKDVRSFYPIISSEGLLGAAFHKEGATINPHLATIAYADASRKIKADINTHTRVVDIKTKGCRIKNVLTDKGEISTPLVINAAELAFGDINKMVGIQDNPIEIEKIY